MEQQQKGVYPRRRRRNSIANTASRLSLHAGNR